MDCTKIDRSRLGNFPELWLTPLLGVFGLCLFTLHDHRSLWRSLQGGLVPAILLAVPLLMLTAVVMRLLKKTPLPLWTRLLVAAVLSCVAVGAFYFVAAAHYYQLFYPTEPSDESSADIIAIWQDEAEEAGLIAAMATVLSGLITSGLSSSRRRT